MRNEPSLKALGRALDFFGNHAAMARALGIASRELWCARSQGKVNGRLAEKIHQVTGGAVRREELRPDLFSLPHYCNRSRMQRSNRERRHR